MINKVPDNLSNQNDDDRIRYQTEIKKIVYLTAIQE